MNIDAYFRRIGYAGPTLPTLDVLRAIARQHAMSIPFENLAVLVSGPPDLELPAVEAKLVHAGRGGYCYEQNALLYAALVHLGFRIKGLSARVRYGVPADVVTPRSHMLLAVDTPDGAVLADAGFGGLTLTAPVMMRWHEEQPTLHETVRLVPSEGDYLLQARIGDDWADVYRFDLTPQLAPDYIQQNWHTATRPNALFANNVIVAMPKPGGRYALFNRTLTWRPVTGDKERSAVDTRSAMRAVLADVFSLHISDAELDTAWEVSGRAASLHPGFS
jgi:N-hydroxyarylamine O-acetyltransferase